MGKVASSPVEFMPTTYIDGVLVRCGCRPRSGERMDQRRCGQPRGEDAWQYQFRRARIWAENEDDTNMSILDDMVNSLHGQYNRWAAKPCLGSRDIHYEITVQWNWSDSHHTRPVCLPKLMNGPNTTAKSVSCNEPIQILVD